MNQTKKKFRIWDVDARTMLLMEDGQGLTLMFHSDGSIGLEHVKRGFIKNFIVMQSTGLHSFKKGSPIGRNGFIETQEVFEDDILRHVNGGGVFRVGQISGEGAYPFAEYGPLAFEVIGNAIENSELLP